MLKINHVSYSVLAGHTFLQLLTEALAWMKCELFMGTINNRNAVCNENANYFEPALYKYPVDYDNPYNSITFKFVYKPDCLPCHKSL